MQASDRQDIYSKYPKKLLGSCFSHKIPSKLRQNFMKNLLALEDSCNDPRDYRSASLMGRGTGRIHDIVDPNLNCLDNSWISTEFLHNNGRVQISGDINNIDIALYPDLYKDIEAIFQEMFPLMREVRDLDHYLSKYNKLNVIVKLQSYQLKANETYEGQFHQEGFKREGIFMIGIYYYHISPNLKGGNLELKYVKEKKFNEEQGCLNYVMEKKQFQVQEGDVAVLLNRRCEHRIDRLETHLAKPEQVYERKILVFFIADPHNSTIPTSKHLKINQQIALSEKDLIYAKRDDFKRNRFVMNDNEVDYSENEGDQKVIKEVFQEKKEKEAVKKNKEIKEINLNVKTLDGRYFSVECDSNFVVDKLKVVIAAKEKISVDELRLIFGGRQMEEGKLLSDYGIENDSTIFLVKRLRGD